MCKCTPSQYNKGLGRNFMSNTSPEYLYRVYYILYYILYSTGLHVHEGFKGGRLLILQVYTYTKDVREIVYSFYRSTRKRRV